MSIELENEKLKHELLSLFSYVQRVRKEIAAINRPADDEHQFESMGEQLDAIVEATEKATNTIMEATEESLNTIDEIRKGRDDPDQDALLDKVISNGNTILEACSFQDITGQRVTKVVKSVTYVEDRVKSLIEIWGKEELDKIKVEVSTKTDDEKLLEGPQLDGAGLDQAAIDALFD